MLELTSVEPEIHVILNRGPWVEAQVHLLLVGKNRVESTVRPSVDGLYRDGTGQISCDPWTKRIQTIHTYIMRTHPGLAASC